MMEISVQDHQEKRSDSSEIGIDSASKVVLISVPEAVQSRRNELLALCQDIDGDLSNPSLQQRLQNRLMSDPAWREWMHSIRPENPQLRPYLLDKGLGFELDDEGARKLLVGFARCFEPDSFVPPYQIGNLAVTEVIAQCGASEASHSLNDLPAPPHSAGFFEDIPPRTCYFSCVRPHPGGGAETTVLDLEKILDQVPQALIDEWSGKKHLLRTSRRLGSQVRAFRLLQEINGVPFLRYRADYMPEIDSDQCLRLLRELVENPANHIIVPLEAGQTLIHWNGIPHSRMAQRGQTPQVEERRRKLIRCRTQPQHNWSENFK